MKITLERLRTIVIEEVIKEELSPEIASPAIAAMLRGSNPEATSEIFGDVFTHMYGEEALEAERDKIYSDEEAPEEKLPTEYQPGGAYGDRPSITLGPVNEIIDEEINNVLNELGEDPEKIAAAVEEAPDEATALAAKVRDEIVKISKNAAAQAGGQEVLAPETLASMVAGLIAAEYK